MRYLVGVGVFFVELFEYVYVLLWFPFTPWAERVREKFPFDDHWSLIVLERYTVCPRSGEMNKWKKSIGYDGVLQCIYRNSYVNVVENVANYYERLVVSFAV